MLVVIDPIDGSLNAKRGLAHHALSIAVADGPTMADVVFGYVYDFGPGEEWVARRGERRARSTASALDPPLGERRTRDGQLELLGDRVRRPALARATSPTRSSDVAHRVRAIGRDRRRRSARSPPRGSTAWPRCGAAARSTPPPAQLIVREAGGHVAFTALRRPARRAARPRAALAVVAARTRRAALARAAPRAARRLPILRDRLL